MAVISETVEYRVLTATGQPCFTSARRDYADDYRTKRAGQGITTRLVKATTVVEELPDG